MRFKSLIKPLLKSQLKGYIVRSPQEKALKRNSDFVIIPVLFSLAPSLDQGQITPHPDGLCFEAKVLLICLGSEDVEYWVNQAEVTLSCNGS